jgi:hypothetical protein
LTTFESEFAFITMVGCDHRSKAVPADGAVEVEIGVIHQKDRFRRETMRFPFRSLKMCGLVGALIMGLLAAGGKCVDLTPANGSLKTIEGGTTTVRDFENLVTRIMQKAGVTGLSCAILNGGKVVYTRGFGWKDKDAATPLDDETAFAAASLSKTVFADLVMVLAEEGAIKLDKPLQEYLVKPLPEYPRYADLAGDDRYRAITARMALSHTTGFPNLRFMTESGRLGILFEPGSRFSCFRVCRPGDRGRGHRR